MSSIKWGVYLRQPEWSVDQLRRFVEEADKLGYHGIYTNDHLIGFDKTINCKEPYLEAWTFMTTVLAWSQRLHAGHTVLAQSFRNPALLAKMISSLDFLSKGRFELFLGAGWNEEEYLAYGYQFPRPGIRLRQLEEAVTIIKNLMNPNIEEWNFKGEFWTLKQNRNFPKPQTQPFPIHLGGEKPKFIKMAARIADGYNTGLSLKRALPLFNQFNTEVKKLEKDPSKRIKSYFGGLNIFKNEQEIINYAKEIIQRNPSVSTTDPVEYAEGQLWGTPEIIATKIRKFTEESGVRFFILKYQCSYDNPLALFWDEVRPLI
ncbi:MAG: LLM class flavin-dependent oxidoreductase [Candidatus Hodarchaeota archaeon]